MAFNSYDIIEARSSKTYNLIYHGWYINCTQTVSAYDIPICHLQR